MTKYIIFCTEAQTKKAMELGAPLIKVDTRDKRMIYYGCLCYPRTEADYPYAIPTAEQMIGWLEEQNTQTFVDNPCGSWRFDVYNDWDWMRGKGGFSSRKEATLAAIDAALEYLTNNKK